LPGAERLYFFMNRLGLPRRNSMNDVVLAIAILFRVRLVVFVVIGDEIVEGEPSSGNEIDTGNGRRPVVSYKSG